MGTQNQTPNSQTQQPNRSGTPGKGDMERQGGSKRSQKGQDAGNVARSDDDVLDEASREGTREDAAGTRSGSSSSDQNEKN